LPLFSAFSACPACRFPFLHLSIPSSSLLCLLPSTRSRQLLIKREVARARAFEASRIVF
jgi:hypothetical protein